MDVKGGIIMSSLLKNWKTSFTGILLIAVAIALLFFPGFFRFLVASGFVLAGIGMILGTDANKIEQKVEKYYQDLIDKMKGIDFNSLLQDAEKK